MQQRDKQIRAQIESISKGRSSRSIFGLGGLKAEARRDLEKLKAEHKDLMVRYGAHEKVYAEVSERRAKTIKRLVRLNDALEKCPEEVVIKAEKPAVQGAHVKKISLNFKRVTGAQAEAVAKGTLVTGGFDLPRLRQQQAETSAEEEQKRNIRRRIAEKEEADRKWEELQDRLRKQEAEARYRRQREEEDRERRMAEERRRADEEDECRYSSRDTSPGKSYGPGYGGSSSSSGW